MKINHVRTHLCQNSLILVVGRKHFDHSIGNLLSPLSTPAGVPAATAAAMRGCQGS